MLYKYKQFRFFFAALMIFYYYLQRKRKPSTAHFGGTWAYCLSLLPEKKHPGFKPDPAGGGFSEILCSPCVCSLKTKQVRRTGEDKLPISVTASVNVCPSVH